MNRRVINAAKKTIYLIVRVFTVLYGLITFLAYGIVGIGLLTNQFDSRYKLSGYLLVFIYSIFLLIPFELIYNLKLFKIYLFLFIWLSLLVFLGYGFPKQLFDLIVNVFLLINLLFCISLARHKRWR